MYTYISKNSRITLNYTLHGAGTTFVFMYMHELEYMFNACSRNLNKLITLFIIYIYTFTWNELTGYYDYFVKYIYLPNLTCSRRDLMDLLLVYSYLYLNFLKIDEKYRGKSSQKIFIFFFKWNFELQKNPWKFNYNKLINLFVPARCPQVKKHNIECLFANRN